MRRPILLRLINLVVGCITLDDEFEFISCRVSKTRIGKKCVKKNRHCHLSLVADNIWFNFNAWYRLPSYLSPCQLIGSDKALLLSLLPLDQIYRRKVLDAYKYQWIKGMNAAPSKKIMMALGRRRSNNWLIENHGVETAAQSKTSNHFDNVTPRKTVENDRDLRGKN